MLKRTFYKWSFRKWYKEIDRGRIMTRTLRLKDLESAAANASEQPFFTTGSSGRNGVRGTVSAPPQAQGLIFSDNFDAQPDWNPTDADPTMDQSSFFSANGDVIPQGWDAVRSTPGWSPSRGYGNGFESMYIKGGPEFTRSGTGKAFVAYRFGRESSAWWGDSILAKTFEGKKELFVKFWIKYQPGWSKRGSSKIIRMQSWNGRNQEDFWNSTNILPSWLWGFSHNAFGNRNKISLRSTNAQTWDDPEIQNLPRSLQNGDLSLGWSTDAFFGDLSPQIPDLVNGGFIPNDSNFIPTQNIVFGSEWREMAFYVKMNSSPGVQDGVMRQWFMGEEVFRNEQIPWIQNGGNPDSCWDVVKIGGNDSWNLYSEDGQETTEIPSSDMATQWYAIDEIEIHDGLPEGY